MHMENDVVFAACWLAAAYLVGAIPFGYLIGRMRGVDVRTVGSKNIGATNVYRTVGKKWGFLAFFCDFAKGFVPTMLCASFAARHADGGALMANLPVCVGLACVVGHTLTVFMRFKGGKGVATAFGMFMALMPCPTLAAFGVFVVTVWLSHYISLGSCLAAAFIAVGVWFEWLGCRGAADLPLCITVTVVALAAIYRHKANIRRLIAGCENRIY